LTNRTCQVIAAVLYNKENVGFLKLLSNVNFNLKVEYNSKKKFWPCLVIA